MDRERKAIEDCDHRFGKAVYDPEEIDDPITELRAHGFDVWPEIVRYHKKQVPRGSKTCEVCGKKIYATKQRPVAFEPDFSGK